MWYRNSIDQSASLEANRVSQKASSEKPTDSNFISKLKRSLDAYQKLFIESAKAATAILSDALLSGPQDSIKFVQKMLGLKPDGIMGPMTISKIWEKSKTSDAEFARAILNKQKEIYLADEQSKIYGQGWANRVDKIKDEIS